MKSPLRNVILPLVVLLVGFNQPGKAQTPDAAELLRDVQARYGSLQSYSATGEVVSGITRDSSASILPFVQSQEVRSPFAIKLAIGCCGFRIRWFEAGSSFRGRIKGFVCPACSTLETLVVIAHVCQEMFDCAEQKRAEAAALWIHFGDSPAREQAGEKFLGQITRRIFAVRASSDEGEHWRIVGSAKVA